MRSIIFFAIVFLLFTLQQNTQGQTPRTISFQGILTDTLGAPKPDGSYSITFRLYESGSGGSALWTEQKTLEVKRGLFQTLLGDQVVMGSQVQFDRRYWLGIQVTADPELAPRIELSAVGYSRRAEKADTAVYALSAPAQAFVDSARIAGTIPNGAVTTAKIANNAVTAVKIASTQVVKSLNTLKDDVTLAAGSNVTITPSGNTLTIASSGGGGGGNVSGTGAAGQVPFWTGTSSIGGDDGLFWDNTNKRLGIGTITPIFPLHVFTSTLYGAVGETDNPTGYGVIGRATAATGFNYGVQGLSNSTGGTGMYGYANATTGFTQGVHGVSASTDGTGTLGRALASTGITNGVYGITFSTSGRGVYGVATATTGFNYGVRGETNSFAGTGVYGSANANSGTNFGIRGETSSPSGYGVFGSATAPTGTNFGVFGGTSSTSGYGVWGYAPSGGYAVYSSGSFRMTTGTFWATPTTTTWTTNKPATVKLNDGTKVKLFAEEAAEVYFTDYGEGTLSNGRAQIKLDPKFLQTVTIDFSHPMRVFVQLLENCNGVYVTNRTATSFDVMELNSGSSNAEFTYRVVCKRKYYVDERLATEEEDIMYNTGMMERAWPEVVAENKEERARIELEQTRHRQEMEEDRNKRERQRTELEKMKIDRPR